MHDFTGIARPVQVWGKEICYDFFTYIGNEEARFRRNPLDKGKKLLEDLF